MELLLNNLVLILTNLFELYVVYRFMYAFFDERKYSLKVTGAVYFFRFAIGTILMIHGTYPVVFMIVSVSTLLFITVCYEASVSKRVVVTIIIWMCMFIAEIIVGLSIQYANFSLLHRIEHIDGMISVMIEVLNWIATLLVRRFRNVKRNLPVPKMLTIAILFVFVISFYMEMLLFGRPNVNDSIGKISLVFVLSLNFIMIYIYDSFSRLSDERIKAELIRREKKYYHAQS
ncbi:MAG: hypothetical protein K6G65_05000, partial [Lachnospiraceae bacterium]|nr:hypothetical protein [Lachnospiraceae bacterium]